MNPVRILLAPGIPDLDALGASCPDDLFGGPAAGLLEEPRAELRSRSLGSVLLRVPLPGTPGSDGRRHGKPRGAGTGFLYLRRYTRAGLRRALVTRFTSPPSVSLAEREWNVLCRLREAGVSTAEPVAVGSRGGGPFARGSFLVTRELEGMLPVPRWMRQAKLERRRRGCIALGRFLARLLRTGIVLPQLELEHLFLSLFEAQAPVEGLSATRLPEAALASAQDGRLRTRVSLREVERALVRLDRGSADAGWSAKERRGLFLRATRGLFDRGERRRLAATLAAAAGMLRAPNSQPNNR